MKITIVTDNKNSWIIPHARELKKKLSQGHQVKHVYKHSDIKPGDVAVFLSCEKIATKQTLKKNTHNLVVHESALPKGKGWSPLTWQILEGKNKIPITLFEATEGVDSGDIYLQDVMEFKGHELIDEMRDIQGKKTTQLILKFIKNYKKIRPRPQRGKETFYKKRTPKDSEISPNDTIKDLFLKLRVADNERYPVFFKHKGKKYTLRIDKTG